MESVYSKAQSTGRMVIKLGSNTDIFKNRKCLQEKQIYIRFSLGSLFIGHLNLVIPYFLPTSTVS